MTEQLIRTMVIMMLAGLSFLQGILPDGMAYNMVPNPSISPTPQTSSRTTSQTSQPTPQPTPEPTPTPIEEPTPEPTPEWVCPVVEVEKRKDYMPICVPICEAGGYDRCEKRCGDCWKDR